MKAGVTVGDAMTIRPVTASPGEPIHNVAILMDTHKVGSVLITEGKDVRGIITERDFVINVSCYGAHPMKTPACELMKSDLLTVSPCLDLFDALHIMKENDIRHLPVVENGALIGLITSKDILKLQPHLFENFLDMIDLREEKRKLSVAREKNPTATIEED